jgi:hypothetical protein
MIFIIQIKLEKSRQVYANAKTNRNIRILLWIKRIRYINSYIFISLLDHSWIWCVFILRLDKFIFFIYNRFLFHSHDLMIQECECQCIYYLYILCVCLCVCVVNTEIKLLWVSYVHFKSLYERVCVFILGGQQ